jgi:endonuclease IV
MSPTQFTCELPSASPGHRVREEQIEHGFIGKLQSLKYQYREDIRDRASLERNFREHFEALDRVKLSDAERIHEPIEMGEDNKELFRRILNDFITAFQFELPKILESSLVPPQSATALAT